MAITGKFSVLLSPYVRRATPGLVKNLEIVRGFTVKNQEGLRAAAINGILPFKRSMHLDKTVKSLGVPAKMLKANGFTVDGIDLQVFLDGISAGNVLDIKLRQNEALSGQAYLSAVIGRTCEPSLVLRDFDIKDALQRYDVIDSDKFILAAKFIRFQAGKELPVNDIPAVARYVADISSGYIPTLQLAPLHYQCEQWYFIGMMSKQLLTVEQIDEPFVMEALHRLMSTTEAPYQADEAMSWIKAYCK